MDQPGALDTPVEDSLKLLASSAAPVVESFDCERVYQMLSELGEARIGIDKATLPDRVQGAAGARRSIERARAPGRDVRAVSVPHEKPVPINRFPGVASQPGAHESAQSREVRPPLQELERAHRQSAKGPQTKRPRRSVRSSAQSASTTSQALYHQLEQQLEENKARLAKLESAQRQQLAQQQQTIAPQPAPAPARHPPTRQDLGSKYRVITVSTPIAQARRAERLEQEALVRPPQTLVAPTPAPPTADPMPSSPAAARSVPVTRSSPTRMPQRTASAAGHVVLHAPVCDGSSAARFAPSDLRTSRTEDAGARECAPETRGVLEQLQRDQLSGAASRLVLEGVARPAEPLALASDGALGYPPAAGPPIANAMAHAAPARGGTDHGGREQVLADSTTGEYLRLMGLLMLQDSATHGTPEDSDAAEASEPAATDATPPGPESAVGGQEEIEQATARPTTAGVGREELGSDTTRALVRLLQSAMDEQRTTCKMQVELAHKEAELAQRELVLHRRSQTQMERSQADYALTASRTLMDADRQQRSLMSASISPPPTMSYQGAAPPGPSPSADLPTFAVDIVIRLASLRLANFDEPERLRFRSDVADAMGVGAGNVSLAHANDDASGALVVHTRAMGYESSARAGASVGQILGQPLFRDTRWGKHLVQQARVITPRQQGLFSSNLARLVAGGTDWREHALSTCDQRTSFPAMGMGESYEPPSSHAPSGCAASDDRCEGQGTCVPVTEFTHSPTVKDEETETRVMTPSHDEECNVLCAASVDEAVAIDLKTATEEVEDDELPRASPPLRTAEPSLAWHRTRRHRFVSNLGRFLAAGEAWHAPRLGKLSGRVFAVASSEMPSFRLSQSLDKPCVSSALHELSALQDGEPLMLPPAPPALSGAIREEQAQAGHGNAVINAEDVPEPVLEGVLASPVESDTESDTKSSDGERAATANAELLDTHSLSAGELSPVNVGDRPRLKWTRPPSPGELPHQSPGELKHEEVLRSNRKFCRSELSRHEARILHGARACAGTRAESSTADASLWRCDSGSDEG